MKVTHTWDSETSIGRIGRSLRSLEDFRDYVAVLLHCFHEEESAKKGCFDHSLEFLALSVEGPWWGLVVMVLSAGDRPRVRRSARLLTA